MSNCAANEKKNSITQLNEWIQQELNQVNLLATAVYPMYCMVYVLLGFHHYGTNLVMNLQKELIATEGKIGRDVEGVFFRFKHENVPVRIT